jgi:C4-dicarboxylate transporter DctM subunit
MFLIAAGNLMGWILTMSGSTETIASNLTGLITNKYVMLLVINILCLIIGCFIEPTPALLVVLPIFDPIIQQFGFDPLHFGIMLCFNLCVGMLTPPVGLGLYVMCSVWDVKFEQLTRAVMPFLWMMLISLILITYLPWLSTWLPKMIMPY